MLLVAVAEVLEAVVAVSVLDDLLVVPVVLQEALQEAAGSEILARPKDLLVQVAAVSSETAAQAKAVAAQVTVFSETQALPRRVDLVTEILELEKSQFTQQDQFFTKDILTFITITILDIFTVADTVGTTIIFGITFLATTLTVTITVADKLLPECVNMMVNARLQKFVI